LQDGLDELRLLMDSSDAGHTLHGALIAWRNRWDSRLDALDVTLRWQLDERVEAITMDPGDVLQLMRVLQEAVTNVVKHAGARHADVRIALDPQGPWLELDVADDGCGFAADAAMRGRGTSNMRTRARLLGGSLAIEARGGGAGTVVRLRVPVQVAGVQRAAVAMAK
jgi:signal transduction histidine kinase